MNKKLSIFSIILVIVGAIGSIYSGLKAIPYVTDKIYEIKREVEKEQTIYNEQLDINKLNIDTVYTHVIIKKHDEQSVKVVKTGVDNENSYNIESNNKELILKEKDQPNKFNYNYKINNLDDLIKLFASKLYERNQSITVYIPNNVDLNISTKYASLQVKDNILLNDVYFKTIYGNISLPREVKNLKILDIVAKDYIRLSMGELLGIENVNVVSDLITIYSNDNDIFIEDIEKYIPNNVNLSTESSRDSYGGSINISTDIPVGNNVNVNGYKSQVELNIPVNKFKFNVDMKASENIEIDDLNNNDDSGNNIIREIKGTLNKNLDSLEKEYKMNIKAQHINML